MLVIPLFWNPLNKQFGIFLSEGGRSVWSVDDSVSNIELIDMLKENGFPIKYIKYMNGNAYILINYNELKLDDFYLWSDIDPLKSDKDVWRIFSIPDELLNSEKFKTLLHKNFYLNY